MADIDPANIVPLEPRRRSAAATLRTLHACLREAAAARLSGEELRAYCALLLFIDENGECFPSQATLAELTGLERRSVRRALASIQTAGLLRRSPRWRDDGARLSDLYKVGRDAAPVDNATPPWREDAPAPGANPWREDATAPGANPWREDAPRKGETQNKTNQDINLERGSGSDVDGRSAPLLHSNTERVATPEPQSQKLVHDQHAYGATVTARKRQGFLARLNSWASRKYRGRDLERAWCAIAEASDAGSRAATPKATSRFLDQLEEQRRAELSSGGAGNVTEG